VARALLDDLASGATVDRHLADQLIIFAALAAGTSVLRLPQITDHVPSNLWLVETILGAHVHLEGHQLSIPTVSSLLIPVASYNFLFLQSLPTGI
jgi:RNA 3'-terminal phosphate cyclase (ATP)